MHTRFWWGTLRERDHLKDLGIGGRIILNWIVRPQDGGRGQDSSGSEQGQLAEFCECGVKVWGSLKFREFFE
jgi:hypothetical protein